jgi:6-pyruvoyltetrahydropterin/6-carboxytetrahydropterin synthase
VSWKILIEQGNLGFSAAHFITLGDQVEPLHGHNYGVRVEAAGALMPESFVLDFVTLKDIVRALCKEWDHRFLLPLHNRQLDVRRMRDVEWEIRVDPRTRYVLPASAVVALPVDNVTAERLAELLARRILVALESRGIQHQLERLTVGIAETEMQTAFYSCAVTPAGLAEDATA